MPFAIEPASDHDLPRILALLRNAGLTSVGIQKHVGTTLIARNAGDIAGCAALELYGTVALLRSVAVDHAYRGYGLGERLTHAALNLARRYNLRQVYLLTETADGFFPRFGFQPIQRSNVLPAIHHSIQWTTICPSTAQAMVIDLTAPTDLT